MSEFPLCVQHLGFGLTSPANKLYSPVTARQKACTCGFPKALRAVSPGAKLRAARDDQEEVVLEALEIIAVSRQSALEQI